MIALAKRSFKCILYDWIQWTEVDTAEIMHKLGYVVNLDYKLCYDGYGIVYVVTFMGHVVSYDLAKDEWQVLKVLRSNEFLRMQPNFVIWIEQYDTEGIYCTDGEDLRYFCVETKQWKSKIDLFDTDNYDKICKNYSAVFV